MNEKRKAILKLCSDRPRSVRDLVGATGDRVSTVRHQLYDLVSVGALKRTSVKDQYGTHLYHSVPGWSRPSALDESSYKPLGICVWGVWM